MGLFAKFKGDDLKNSVPSSPSFRVITAQKTSLTLNVPKHARSYTSQSESSIFSSVASESSCTSTESNGTTQKDKLQSTQVNVNLNSNEAIQGKKSVPVNSNIPLNLIPKKNSPIQFSKASHTDSNRRSDYDGSSIPATIDSQIASLDLDNRLKISPDPLESDFSLKSDINVETESETSLEPASSYNESNRSVPKSVSQQQINQQKNHHPQGFQQQNYPQQNHQQQNLAQTQHQPPNQFQRNLMHFQQQPYDQDQQNTRQYYQPQQSPQFDSQYNSYPQQFLQNNQQLPRSSSSEYSLLSNYMDSTNELVAATRRSSIRSKRFSSAPSIDSTKINSSKRVLSSTSSFRPSIYYDDESTADGEFAKPYGASQNDSRSSSTYMAQNLDGDDIPVKRHISDYSKFLFEEDEEEEKEEEDATFTEATSKNIKKPLLVRSLSANSAISGNSIQSDNSGKFKVDSTRLHSLSSNQKQTRQSTQFNPRMSLTQSYGHIPNHEPINALPTRVYNGEYDPLSRRQSLMSGIVRPRAANRMSMIQLPSNYQQEILPRTNDATINRKIEEFIQLRMVISSGNKSLAYRLKWVQTLISAVNYNLYSFINIKGEPVGMEFALHNKALFVKSATTHLFKLLKEDTKKHENIRREVYYTYGCLLKHDYLKFDEDFGIEKDLTYSIEMFDKCLQINPQDYKTIFKLGEIHEEEGDIENALEMYKEAAPYTNRAIYHIAMLYLNNPQVRSLKFIKYLTDLANIHIDDIEVKNPDEFDEVCEVIGLAAYELGKIYEGIYPGGLSLNDEFVQRSLEVVPINYAKSLTYYNKSAKSNCILGYVKLGNVYEFGELNRGVNPNKSIQWYTKACTSPVFSKRHPDAMLGLSRWNAVGSGGSNRQIPVQNPHGAVMWCERALKEYDSVDAMYWMGELSEMGYTTTNAKMWYSKAYNLGHVEAGRKLGFADESPELSEEDEEEEEEEVIRM